MRSIHRRRSDRTLVRHVSVAIGLCFAALATGILPLTARADGGPAGAPPACFAPTSGMTQVAFPVGATPPSLPYPQQHQLTDEYSDRGFTFSDDDSDMAVEYRRYTPTPATYNVVRQSTLSNVYRVDLLGDDVREVRLTLRDSNTNATVHRLSAFSGSGSHIASNVVNDALTAPDFPFVLSVSSTGAPIRSVVFTQRSTSGEPGLFSTVLTCIESGTPAPTPTSTPTPTPTSTPTPAPACPPAAVVANADAWFEQSSTVNKGADSSLKVRSKSGSAAIRAAVRFPLPMPPAGCVLDSAQLRLYAESAKSGRTILVQRAATHWNELSVNWQSQPFRSGTTSAASSGSVKGWRTWTVTPQVADMYATGSAHGFVVFDKVETQDSEQVYRSRESGSNVPTLVIGFRPRTGPSTASPSPSATATPTPTPTLSPSPTPASTATLTPSPSATPTPRPTATPAPATPSASPTPTPTPSPTPTCAPVAVVADADAWFEQSSTANKGDDSSLKVRSKSGDDAFRATVRFPLPSAPAACVFDSAELHLYAEAAKPGRNVLVRRAASAWSEMSVTWPTQPERVGATSSAASGSDKGWRVWTVTQQVAEMYATGSADGFVIFDEAETDDSEQVYRSRESGSDVPTLVLTFRVAS